MSCFRRCKRPISLNKKQRLDLKQIASPSTCSTKILRGEMIPNSWPKWRDQRKSRCPTAPRGFYRGGCLKILSGSLSRLRPSYRGRRLEVFSSWTYMLTHSQYGTKPIRFMVNHSFGACSAILVETMAGLVLYQAELDIYTVDRK